jgi:hypothetical protein
LRLDCFGLSHPVAELAATAEGYRAVTTGATINRAVHDLPPRRWWGEGRFVLNFPFLGTRHERVFALSPLLSPFSAYFVGFFLIF